MSGRPDAAVSAVAACPAACTRARAGSASPSSAYADAGAGAGPAAVRIVRARHASRDPDCASRRFDGLACRIRRRALRDLQWGKVRSVVQLRDRDGAGRNGLLCDRVCAAAARDRGGGKQGRAIASSRRTERLFRSLHHGLPKRAMPRRRDALCVVLRGGHEKCVVVSAADRIRTGT